MYYFLMFGFGIYLIHLVDFLSTKKFKKCQFCNMIFKNKNELDLHLNQNHSNPSSAKQT